ncbi:DUF5050 domain-containing protein [Bacillus sp. MUM 13]|uniref:DUF5050 domain-containing protein n=1 Tax=Bacillus sp. MUM 13 TaxID=1678001 RepID=UPI0008F56FAF|nr:DUF5050 domain-containing protein [Bacillus sp. MUM 13]OIK09253.1 hypothetical protein BIV59_17500 [Bacillus sp. MUM 13]
MKKYYVILMILLLIGCENEPNKEFGEKGTPNLTGNSYGNLINNGFVAKQDNLLIYMKYNDSHIPLISNNDIMIKEKDGTNEVKLTSKGFGDLNVLGEWVYYTVMPFSDIPMLYRIKLNGIDKEKLVKGADYVQVKNDQIYYYDSIKNGIYKMNLDGTDKVQIYSPKQEVTMNFYVDREHIYFYKPIDEDGEEGKLYSMSLNGENVKKLNDTVSYLQIIIDADEEYLYYTDTDEHLYKVDKQKGKEMKITDQKFSSIIVDKDWIYYLNAGDHYYLYKMKKNGENNQLLIQKEISDINVLDNWIYYKLDGHEDIFRVKTDGTKNRLFSKHK